MRYIKSQMVFLLYKSLLMKYGEEAVLEIFKDVSYNVNGESISRCELFTLFNNKTECEVQLTTLIELYRNIEEYIKRHTLSINELLSEIISVRAKAFSISQVQVILKLLEPYLHEAFTTDNLYLFVFKIIEVVHANQIKGSSYRLIGHEETPSGGIGCMELFYDSRKPGAYAYDISLWKNYIIRESPRMIGIPPFKRVEVMAECRSVESILTEVNYQFEGDSLIVDGKIVGVKIEFLKFLESNTLFANASKLEQWEVVLITEDVKDIDQDRLLLQKGCCYNAPYVLMNVVYDTIKLDSSRILQQLVSANNNDNMKAPDDESEFMAKHASLLSRLTETVLLEYNYKQQKLSINGEYVLKNFPAQLLWWIVKKYVDEGRSNFTYQDIVVDSFFVLDLQKPNITTRFTRLKEKLKNEYPFMQITSTGRGTFTFACKKPLVLKVIE